MPGSREGPGASDVRETGRRVLEIEAKAIADLASRLDGAFERAAELLLACQGRVVVTGMGKSRHRGPEDRGGRSPPPGPRPSSCILPRRCTGTWGCWCAATW
jgi:hypothetical protein